MLDIKFCLENNVVLDTCADLFVNFERDINIIILVIVVSFHSLSGMRLCDLVQWLLMTILYEPILMNECYIIPSSKYLQVFQRIKVP